jgi:DNA-binding transcriptional LysR family regulator
MDNLSGISMFVQVAETRSFTKAGRQLGVSSSAVGKAIARMEERLHVRLFHRSTRSITLTAEGSVFLERCRRILSEIEAAEAELSGLAGNPRGRLRVGTPQLGGLMMPAFDGFMERYPEIELDIEMSDRMVDVVEDGFDAVIRTGELTDSRLAARRLGSCPYVLVASPTYFKRHGVPTRPRELEGHFCLLHKWTSTGKLDRWQLRLDASESELVLPETLTSNTIEPLAHAAILGRGIAFLPAFLVRDALQCGQLITALDDYVDREVVFWILWPASRYASPKLRVFIDYMGAHLRI